MSYLKKHNKFILIFLGILLTLSVLVGISYAYYMVTASQTNKNRLASSCISISLTNEKNDITLNNAYPITDSEGKKLTPYQFTITNTCNIFISYNVNLEMLEGTDLSTDYIKTMVNSEAPYILSSLDSASTTIDKSTESRTLAQGSLGSGDSVDYALKIWMDENTPLNNDTQDKSLISKIVVVAQPSTYKPSDYVTTLHDAILVNEYGVKNVDNAISKIEAKGTPDLSKTAPIITWNSKIESDTTVYAYKPHPSIIGKESFGTQNLTQSDSLIKLGTSYSFDQSTGKYNIDNMIYFDPTTVDFKEKNYYYCSSGVNISDTNNTVSPFDTPGPCNKIYIIRSATKSTTSEENTIFYRVVYKMTATQLGQQEQENDKSDRGLYSSIDDLGTTYYYRGNVKNNNVYFGGYYWQIIRINGNNSIRLIYNGAEPNTQENNIGKSAFNITIDNPAYVGYMYGNNIGTRENNIKNENSSTIKKVLDVWYENNIKKNNFDTYISDSGFCNDRSLKSGDGASLSNHTYFGLNSRISNNNYSFLCPNKENDLFTLATSIFGNKSLTYPIGLITYDELAYSGQNNNVLNRLSWTYSDNAYWSMTPDTYSAIWNGSSVSRTDATGTLIKGYNVSIKYGVRPVINLKPDVEISGGIGTINDPYIVKTN